MTRTKIDGRVYYDPYDVDIAADPYPVYRRLHEEAPLYYNEVHDFFAVSRADDVERVLADHESFISGRGAILDFIRADLEMPPGMLIFEDPPIHTRHRKIVSRIFTPRRVADLEPQIRAFAVRSLDSVVGSGRFDFIADLGAQLPMRTIGMLLGIPEADQVAIREQSDHGVRSKPGEPMKPDADFGSGEMFAEYIDWRADHPSDDLMTELLHVEFEDETGTVRRLTREEVLTYTSLIAAAGSETTGHLIAWTREGPGRPSRPAARTRRRSLTDPRCDRGSGALRIACAAVLPVRPDERRAPRHDGARGQRDDGHHGVGQPRRSRRPRRRSLGHPSHRGPPLQLRPRRPLLPGRRARTNGRPDRAGGDPAALPRVGDRHRQRAQDVVLHSPRMGRAPAFIR